MKIRIKGDMIRFRLSKSEIDQIIDQKEIAESIHFPTGKLTYMVLAYSKPTISASFENQTISLFLPEQKLEELKSNDCIGFQETIDIDNDRKLILLFEKDFKCLDNTIEDQSDNYPNPLAEKFHESK